MVASLGELLSKNSRAVEEFNEGCRKNEEEKR